MLSYYKKSLYLFLTLTTYYIHTEQAIINNFYVTTPQTQTVQMSHAFNATQKNFSEAIMKELLHNSDSFMHRYKKYFAGLAGICIYTKLFASIVQANQKLADYNSWASWKHEYSCEQLKELDPEELVKDLLWEIEKRHTNQEKPADALLPFITFLEVIDKEIKEINYYRSLYFWLQSLHVTRLFPINKEKFASVNMKLERLWFIKNLFLHWAAGYKLSLLITPSESRALWNNKNRTFLYKAPRPSTTDTPSIKPLIKLAVETAIYAQGAALVGAAAKALSSCCNANSTCTEIKIL